MKSVNMYKLGAALVFACLIITSCPSPFSASYYIQQQNRSAQNGGGQEDPGNGDTPTPPEQPLEPGTISMFSVILPDGKLAEPNNGTTVYDQLAEKLNASDGFPFAAFPTAKFDDWKFSSNFSASNVPEPKYSGTVTWVSAPENTNPEREKYGGKENASAGSNSISSITYYRYCGKNPFNLYTSETYDIYGEDGKSTGQKEALMKRFIFYRFTGKAVIVSLDNYLVAVDTYTKLVFAFAKPLEFGSVGQPTKWASVDTHSVGPGGKTYRFYQYDPIGYVKEDGSFYLNDTYKGNQASGNYDPTFTGKSPYIGFVGDARKPAINISNIVLKNISLRDVGGDYPIGGGYNQAEFKYELKARYNNEEWDPPFSSNKGGKLSIDTGSHQKLPGAYVHEIAKPEEGSHSITLSADIWEVDPLAANADDVIIKHEKPLFTLTYDTANDSWKLTGNSIQSYKDKDGEWKVKSVTMNEVKRGKKSTMKIDLSAYISDVVWDSWLPSKVGWGDMELSFDVEWK